MYKGKQTCKILKEIRQQIADKNNIKYITDECHFQGDCKGTCPKCEAELRYLENELSKRKQFGKAVAVAGISLGIAGSFANCNAPKQDNMPIFEQEITTETIVNDTVDTISVVPEMEMEKLIIPTVGGIDEYFLIGEVAPTPNYEYIDIIMDEPEPLNE